MGTPNRSAAAASPFAAMYSGSVMRHSVHVSCASARGSVHDTLNKATNGAGSICAMPPDRATIAARLIQFRADRGWTLREVSAATNGLLSPSRISNYEQGLREIGIPEAKVLAAAYNTSAAHLMRLDDDNPVLSPIERQHIDDLRALPENERHAYIRRIAAVALAYKDPVADERIPAAFKPAPPLVVAAFPPSS